MSERILRLKPEEVAKFFTEGKMEEVKPVPSVDPTVHETSHVPDNNMIERAKKLLGKDFLGVEAIRNMETKLKGVGVDVQFILDKLPIFPYTEKDLQVARISGEMLVLRPETMRSGGSEIPLTLMEFEKLFRNDPLKKLETVFWSFRPQSDSFVPCWYEGEKFATSPGEIKLGWSLVKKGLLDGSVSMVEERYFSGVSTDWTNQESLLRRYEDSLKLLGCQNVSVKRRTATETVYDELLYYVNTEELLLPSPAGKRDWTRTHTSTGASVCVGPFSDFGGLVVVFHESGHSYSTTLGVCPSR